MQSQAPLQSFFCFVIVTYNPLGCSPAPMNEPARAPSARERREAHVREHDIAASTHAAEFNPSSGGRALPCVRAGQDCWEPRENSTAEHARHAEEHRRQADSERAALGGPPTPEDVACAGIAAAARRSSPLAAVEIVRVEAIDHGTLESPQPTLFGARLTVRSPATPAQLMRSINCHVEHFANAPEPDMDMQACPLVVPSAFTTVRDGEDGTVVDIRSSDERSAAEVLRRAKLLARAR